MVTPTEDVSTELARTNGRLHQLAAVGDRINSRQEARNDVNTVHIPGINAEAQTQIAKIDDIARSGHDNVNPFLDVGVQDLITEVGNISLQLASINPDPDNMQDAVGKSLAHLDTLSSTSMIADTAAAQPGNALDQAKLYTNDQSPHLVAHVNSQLSALGQQSAGSSGPPPAPSRRDPHRRQSTRR